MNNELYKKFVKIREKKEALIEEESLLKEEIIADLRKNKLDKIESNYGKFTIANKRNYTYSTKIEDMSEKLKIAKNKEVEKGIAVESITNYLVYTENK